MDVSRATPATEIQFPTWNCLYQIRDFVKDLEGLEAQCDGQAVALARLDLNTWRGPGRPCGHLEFQYTVTAQEDGPYSSRLDSEHAFLNLAMLLFYLPQERGRPTHVKVLLPEGWEMATLLASEENEFAAENYDALVDSPIEAGHFDELTFTQQLPPAGAGSGAVEKRATVRIIVHADRKDYSSRHLLDSIRKIVNAETTLMQDLPFERYTFILHFPRTGERNGGMEHRDGAAITLPASLAKDPSPGFADTVAHELFHAWNVKRVRPQALEPIDYVHGNDTRDLWFSEGVTSTYAELALLRAGLIDRETFYARVAGAIETLQGRPARHFQTVETAGEEAWLEKYPDYSRPERSISYYNKGELLGFLLDLGIRHASQNRAGLDDVMRRLNLDFARQGRFYTLADIRAIISQLAPSFAVDQFLRDYVQGTEELDYSQYLGYAGLHVSESVTELPLPGFSVARNSVGAWQAGSIDTGSDAEQAGLRPDDILVKADGEPLPTAAGASLPSWRPSQVVELEVQRQAETLSFRFKVGVNRQVSVQLTEIPHASSAQLRVREGWLTGQTRTESARE